MSLTPDLLDFSHDAGLRAWVTSANAEESDFPIQNLPVGVFRPAGSANLRAIAPGQPPSAAPTIVFASACTCARCSWPRNDSA